MEHRVVITGMGAVSPYGESVDRLWRGLLSGKCAIHALDEAFPSHGVNCRVAAMAPAVDARRIPRPLRRSMSPMSVFVFFAAEEALRQAGLPADASRPRTGVSIGSTIGSPHELNSFFAEYLSKQSAESIYSTTFFKVMGHTVAANTAQAFHCTGRQIAPAAACASGLIGIGLGFEAIRSGYERLMLCGGADEFHLLTAASFDRMGALSQEESPMSASRPFDAARSGLVCGEGAGVLLLESLESAQKRGVPILAEIAGYASITSCASLAYPDAPSIVACMGEALAHARQTPADVVYISAHATGTEAGDVAEGLAVAELFGHTPVSSLKGHLGHTLAASGALETIACVNMLRDGRLLPTLGLESPDPRCGAIAPLMDTREIQPGCIVKNSFAMGGVYASLVLKPWNRQP